MAIVKTIFQFRRDHTENWLLNGDVVPAAGEPCFDLDLHTLKIGDGETTYANLPAIGGVELKVEADGKSIVLKDDTFQLMNFDAAAIGAQPRKNGNGELEWVVPSTETVDGLKSAVSGLQSDVAKLQTAVGTIQDIIEPSGENAKPLLSRVETIEMQINGVGEGTVDAKIDAKIEKFAESISDDGKVNTLMELIKYVNSHGEEAANMAANITILQGLVGGTSVADQIANAGHMTKAEAEDTLLSKVEAAATLQHIKYEISHKPAGTLVNYGDKEIRVMCPADTQWVKQSVGGTGNANMYYMGFKAYAPAGAVSFKEDDQEIIADQTMYYFENNDFAGIDKFGRKYSIVWLALAYYDEASDKWTYFGANSTAKKYIGWYYSVEWYDADGKKIDSDCIRINLSNESCHHAAEPYYMASVVKGIEVGGTLLDVVDNIVKMPAGVGLKSSDEVEVNEDGTLSIKNITFDKIEQSSGDIVFDGGSAAN